MAYQATKTSSGTYFVTNNGVGVATVAASQLSNYGLSPSQLTSGTQGGISASTTSAPAPAPAPVSSAAPAPVAAAPAGSSYLQSLQNGLQQAQSSSSPNYAYITSLQQAIATEQNRQGAITSKAEQLKSGGAGSADIQAYLSTLSQSDQALASSILNAAPAPAPAPVSGQGIP